jgi:hypothetical protein
MTAKRWLQTRWLGGVLAVAVCLALTGATRAELPNNLHAQLQRSTGFVVVNKGNGQLAYGTCWVADIERKLVVTNVHVVTNFAEAKVTFARYDDKGNLLTNSGAYSGSDFVPGKVLYRDGKRDLALIQLNTLPRGVVALAPATKSIDAGQPIWSIGNSGMAGKQLNAGTLWRPRTGKVQKAFFWKTKLTNVEQMLEVRVIQTDSGVKGGDSGGPIVDSQGKLVGVVSCNNNEGDFGIDVGEVRTFLQRAQQAKPPAAQSPAVGTWTVTWTFKGRDYYASMTLNADGSGLWEGSKQFTGTFKYAKGQLTLNLPDSGVTTKEASVTWNSNDQFTFSIAYSDGPTTFTAVRR